MKKLQPFYYAFLISLIFSQPSYGQLKNDFPAPSNVPNSEYPYISSNGKVTFRVKAPLAEKVQLMGRDNKIPFGEKPTDLIRGKGGVWTVTILINPGFHY